VDIGVGESGSRDANGGAATGCPDGVVSAARANTQGSTFLPKVPTNPGEEFYATAKAEETHGLCGVRVRGRWVTHEVFSLIIVGWNGYAVPFFCMMTDVLP